MYTLPSPKQEKRQYQKNKKQTRTHPIKKKERKKRMPF
jgi:hypothetical protein